MSDKKPDEFHGLGGSYIVEGGKRKLVARTLDVTDPEHPDNVKPREAEQSANKAAQKKGA